MHPFALLNQRTVRAEVNPLDKATIISIFPKKLDEKKPTIVPGRFVIEPGTYENPSLLVVGPSSWWRHIDDNQPMLEITNNSLQVADSIVKDFCNGYIECDMGEHMPGLFYVGGSHTVDAIKKNFPEQLQAAKRKQDNWYQALVRQADIDWSRTNGNPLSVSTDAKMAARTLGLLNKDWLRDQQVLDMVRCVACGSLRNPAYPICQHCKAIIDVDAAKKLNLQFAS